MPEIRLDYFTEEDFDQLIAWSGDRDFLLQWAGPTFTHPLTREQLWEYLRGNNDMDRSPRMIYKALDWPSGKTVGHLSIAAIDRANRSCALGKVLLGDPDSRGKGLGRQLIEAALAICFDEMKMHRVFLDVFDFNLGALRCYEKAGFVREGTLRESRLMSDGFHDMIAMSILEEEWRLRKTESKEMLVE